MLQTSTRSRIKVYYELTKPRIWYLLVFTAFGAAVTASNVYDVEVSIYTWVLVIMAVASGSAAANTITNYRDRDIDSVMTRTQSRPIPSKRITPGSAKKFGLLLALIAIILTSLLSYTTTIINGILATFFMCIGLFDNIIVYSYLLKRKSKLNIILGGFSGAAPSMIGYVAVTTEGLFTLGLIIGGLVFIWIPMHIWALALHYKKDYNKVDVPMLTSIISERAATRVISFTTMMMVSFSITPFFIQINGQTAIGLVYLITAIISGIVITTLSLMAIVKPLEKKAWLLFKFSNPYLAILFIALMLGSI
ncbi:MAG: heme o synthase [Thaumarchaeota archaeon]|nr:heme o synthase [Nitrososphaerota archaeon]MCY3976084.1 heme o synthase [Nitrososphaerota archaeon]